MKYVLDVEGVKLEVELGVYVYSSSSDSETYTEWDDLTEGQKVHYQHLHQNLSMLAQTVTLL